MTKADLQRALEAIPDDVSVSAFKIAYDHAHIATECGLMAEKSATGQTIFFCVVSDQKRRIHFGATENESLYLAVEKAYLGIVQILEGVASADIL